MKRRCARIEQTGTSNDYRKRGISAAYCDYLDRFPTSDSFDEYARSAWLDPERHLRRSGLWRTYCCDRDGTPLPIRILRFDNIAAD